MRGSQLRKKGRGGKEKRNYFLTGRRWYLLLYARVREGSFLFFFFSAEERGSFFLPLSALTINYPAAIASCRKSRLACQVAKVHRIFFSFSKSVKVESVESACALR